MSYKSNELALAQELFNKAVIHIMDLPIVDDTIIALGKDIALTMLDEIYNRNTDPSLNDFYCGVRDEMDNIEY
jgi:hypothetical protein